MAEYIERQAVIDLLKGAGEESGSSVVDIELTIEAVQNDISTADVVPAKHAHWIPNKWTQTRNQLVSCSRCGCEASYPGENYCPNCGAEMDEEGENG